MNKPGCSGWMIPVFLGGIFTLIGAVMLAWQLYLACWPATTGTLLEAKVAERRVMGGAAKGGPSYYPQVKFSYAVMGQTWQGHEYTASRFSSSDGWAQSKVDALWQQQRAQGHITVYYKPGNPSRSALTKSDLPGMMGWAFSPWARSSCSWGLDWALRPNDSA